MAAALAGYSNSSSFADTRAWTPRACEAARQTGEEEGAFPSLLLPAGACHLFARKFAPEAADALLELAREQFPVRDDRQGQ